MAKNLSISVDVGLALMFLKSTEKNVEIGVDKAFSEIAMFMEGEVKQSLSGNRAEPKRVDTGHLRQSVKGTTPKRFSAKIESNLPYAAPIEYGTTKIKPGRHFRNTLTRNKSKVISYINDEIKKQT